VNSQYSGFVRGLVLAQSVWRDAGVRGVSGMCFPFNPIGCSIRYMYGVAHAANATEGNILPAYPSAVQRGAQE
jgi:hypothetical protein